MKKILRQFGRYIPLLVGVGILVAIAFFVPWHDVLDQLKHLRISSLLVLVLLSALYYIGKIVRYWYMVQALGHRASFLKVGLAIMVAQPPSILPGGELYRGAMLQLYANVPIQKSSSIVISQGLVEAISLLIIALIGAAVLHHGLVPVIFLSLLFVCIIVIIKRSRGRKTHKFVNTIPKVNVSKSTVRTFLSSNQELLSGKNFIVLLLASFITALAGAGIIFVSAHAINVPLTFFQATIAYALPVVVAGISFLPGGLGLSEQGLVGMLTLMSVSVPAAVAITLLMRIFTLGIGLVYGIMAIAYTHLFDVKHYEVKSESSKSQRKH